MPSFDWRTKASTPTYRSDLLEHMSLLEVVVVDLRDAQGLVTHADHELGESLAVDEHDAAARFGRGLLRVAPRSWSAPMKP